jgi:D-xylose transport system substrate-binding protein
VNRVADRPWRARPAVALTLLLAAAGCGFSDGGSGPTIALLLPETKTARYETHDRPHFTRTVRALCRQCRVYYANASQDAAGQQAQAEAALSNRARVLVLDPVDSLAGGAIVARAKLAGVPVISSDRLLRDADIDYYVSFDNEKIGELQARALLGRLTELGRTRGSLVMLNGAPTDSNAALFKRGAHRVLDASRWPIGAEYDTPDWSPDRAQQQMEQAITRLGRDEIAGVYAANDGMAGGALSALTGAGFTELPPVTGQDAELAAVQRILAGSQYMTVYKAIRPEAEAAARLAVALALERPPPAGLINGEIDNGRRRVPSVLLSPVALTRDNVAETVLADGFWAARQVCTDRFVNPCRAAGIQ